MDRGALARRSAFIAAALAVAVAPVSCSGSSDSSNPNDGGPTAEGGGDGDVPEGGVDGSTPTCLDLTTLPVCSSSHWCWVDPFPQGGEIRSIHGLAPNDVWVAAGALFHWDGSTLSVGLGAIDDGYASVFEASPTEIWAVGTKGLVRFQGGAPTVIAPPGITGIAGTGPSDIWVGRADGVSHWDGTTLTDTGFPGGEAYSIAAAGGNAWVSTRTTTTSTSQAYEWSGGTWTVKAAPGQVGQSSIVVAAFGADDAWCASGAQYGKLGGTTFTTSDQQFDQFSFVGGSSDTDVWIGGKTMSGDGSLIHVDGTSSVRVAYSGVTTPSAAWITPGAGLVGDQSGELLLRTGGALAPATSAPLKVGVVGLYQPSSIGGTGPNDVYLAGASSLHVGAIGHFDGCNWSVLDPGVGALGSLHAAWAKDDEVWITGESDSTGTTGVVLHKDASGWTRMTAPDNGVYDTIWGAAKDDVWFGGPTFMHWDGHALSTVPPPAGLPPSPSIASMSGTASDDIWAVQQDSNPPVYHYDGTSWTQQAGAPQSLYAIRAAGKNDVWALEFDGVFHFDGTSWTNLGTGSTTASAPVVIGVVGANDVWFGEGLHWNGTALETLATPLQFDLASWSDGTHLWMAGDRGIVVR